MSAHPELPWRAVIDMRSRIVPGYFDIDLDVLWDAITRDVPRLLGQVQAIRRDPDPRSCALTEF